MHTVQAASRVECCFLGKGIEEFGHGFVATEGILDDASVVQEADVLGTMHEAVHEKEVRGDIVPQAGFAGGWWLLWPVPLPSSLDLLLLVRRRA
ncbi:hypothetical protein RHMOL_Rhmol12G0138100 [Rhododendron molle]|uniref:Uncharacterized protein n=1 Tax=Rhododendron molle TaxID=49168 RepID=A0ACC0LID7_RHOML|nr:hypothetical protein RHMOL_Rhmol12G0138100 [Rhododendron molle]